jgi:hypothetical protein
MRPRCCGGSWIHVGWSEDGREAFGLFGRAPITSAPTMQEQADALADLCAAARLVGGVPPQRQGSALDALGVEDGAA